MKAVLSNRIYMNRTKILQDFLTENLTYVFKSPRPGAPNETDCDVTRVNKDILTIPIGRQEYIPKEFEIVDNRILAPVEYPKFLPTLRDDQESAYEQFKQLKDSCLIKANPGWGKTFMGVFLASAIKQRAIVIVHTRYLFDQWIAEIKKSLGIEPGQIGDKKFEIGDIITVAMVQTVRNNLTDLINKFGLVIVDECHHVPAQVFKSIVDKFRARYKIGLTATPWRKDGRHQMLYDYFGGPDKVINTKDRNRLKPDIIMVESNISFNSNSMIPWGTRLTELYNNISYIELVLNLTHAQVERGHLVLTVADRVEFLKTCHDVTDNSALIIGSTENRDFLSQNLNPVFGSAKIFSEGVDIPPLSSEVLGMPINNRTLQDQLIGRITRKYEGKMHPEVIDIKLLGKTGKFQATSRINYYIDNGYKIKYI